MLLLVFGAFPDLNDEELRELHGADTFTIKGPGILARDEGFKLAAEGNYAGALPLLERAAASAPVRTAAERIARATTENTLGGALKNVVAIACGIAIGAGLGDSARAALMTRGYSEMCQMALALGAKSETLSGLSGLGDLSLTCMSKGSRNYRFGLALGSGHEQDETETVEGKATAKAALKRAQELGLDMPITKAVDDLVSGKIDVREATRMLMSRPQKEE